MGTPSTSLATLRPDLDGSFMEFDLECKRFDYAVVMGFMDYVEDPGALIEKVMAAVKTKACFSFPAREGLLALQRRIRYKWKCPLYMYGEKELERLFAASSCAEFKIERIARDYFVTVSP